MISESIELQSRAERMTPTDVAAHLLSMSVVEFSYTPTTTITMSIDGPNGHVSDTGRGMQLRPDPGDALPHAERALTSVYPFEAGDANIEQVLRALVWGPSGCLGPALANAACTSFSFASHRDGQLSSQHFADGAPTGPPTHVGPTDRPGTEIHFTTRGSIDTAEIRSLIERLVDAIPGLPISFHD